MWYNYYNRPAGETEEEARAFAKEEMNISDIAYMLDDEFGSIKFLLWCLRQKEFTEKFSEDIEKAINRYFEENFTERNDNE